MGTVDHKSSIHNLIPTNPIKYVLVVHFVPEQRYFFKSPFSYGSYMMA